ncbi:MAG TPA: hypothetical protein VFW86_00965 [Candidatus Limnocylindrales bacterium]|jgi:hypothetical protein|nr:hypothetical protein [Candidatus Limnocylindrales bacterium]
MRARLVRAVLVLMPWAGIPVFDSLVPLNRLCCTPEAWFVPLARLLSTICLFVALAEVAAVVFGIPVLGGFLLRRLRMRRLDP